jgi:hypothetical protein
MEIIQEWGAATKIRASKEEVPMSRRMILSRSVDCSDLEFSILVLYLSKRVTIEDPDSFSL